jgi:hypothetical protein
MKFPRLLCTLAIALGFGAAAIAADSPALPPKEQFHLFLLVGQSNMAGRGTVEPQDKVPLPHILMLNKASEWVPAIDPLHFDKPAAGVGIGRSFAAAVAAAKPGVTIGLIPCAVGGSPIDVWQPGAYYQATQSHPWDDAIRRAKVAMTAGTLKGILWHQGESDCSRELAPGYGAKLKELILRFRTELNAPNVPFVAGQLSQFPDGRVNEFKPLVVQVYRDLPAAVPQTAVVSTDGLTHRGDKVHFNSESYREFGRRYAAAYLKLTAKE